MTSIRTIRAALRFASVLTLFCTVALAQLSRIETGTEAWLRYPALTAQAAQSYQSLPSHIVMFGDSGSLKTAEQELVRGVAQMLGETLQEAGRSSPQNAIVLGTLSQLHVMVPALHPAQELRSDGYWLKATKIHGSRSLIVAAANDRGVLYGVFALLSKMARGESLAHIDEVQQPYAPVRWVNQWDNLDGPN
jgi:alpha-glucuronidase